MNDEKLIEYVRMYPCMYDISDGKYVDTKYKSSVWKIIAAEIHESDENCKKRWANIRDQFKKNLNKRKKRTGKYTKVMKKYKFEESLQFLIPHLQDKDTNAHNEEENDEADRDEGRDIDNKIILQPSSSFSQDEPLVESPPSTPSSFSHTPLPPCSAMKARKLSATPRRSPAENNISMGHISDKNEESTDGIHPIDAFMQGLVPTIKRFPPFYQHIAKERIFSVVQELEYEHLKATSLIPQIYPFTGPLDSTSSPASTPPPSSPWAPISPKVEVDTDLADE